MPRFKLSQDSNGFWQFQLLTAAGKVVLQGNPYPFKESCKGAIISTKLAISFDECFEVITHGDQFFYFCIRSLGDTSILGVSDKYANKISCVQAMKVIRDEIKIAVVIGV